MTVTNHYVGDQLSFAAFADKHGLTMEAHERVMDDYLKQFNVPRWYARFKGAEVQERGGLSSPFGDGHTPDAAIRDYALRIQGTRLVIDAFKPHRREIQCPNEWIEEAK